MRIFARRERPHPGAKLSPFEHEDGYRYQLWVTNLPATTKGWRGKTAYIDAGHRVHARVEDCIRTGKDTGIGRFPSRGYAFNQAWMTAAMIAQILLAWLKLLAMDGDLAKAEPKTLRYRVLNAAARLVRGGRQRRWKFAANWPWAEAITRAWQRICALPDICGPARTRPCDLLRKEPGPVEPAAPGRQPGQCHTRTLKSPPPPYSRGVPRQPATP
jgi:Transposase DDE domain group 1